METLVSKFGDKLFLCGGAARDMLLSIKAKDTDYCVEKVSIEEFESALPNVKRIDSSYKGKQQPPVYMYPNVGEVALCRKEISVGQKENLQDLSFLLCQDGDLCNFYKRVDTSLI